MALLPNPYAASVAKFSPGFSDTSSLDNVYKFVGCSVTNLSMSQGFNGNPSSLDITLVEDKKNGDLLTLASVPVLAAFSLPKGGVGQPLFVSNSFSFHPNAFNPTNVPFYFCGLLSSFKTETVSIQGKTISLRMIDLSEILGGVKLLIGGFSLSQSLGTGGGARYADVDNIIDVFGYFDSGYTSELNQFGMPFYKIRQAIEATRVKLFGLNIEFQFVGDAFTTVPNWYRIKGDIVDIVSIARQVGQDGGSDVAFLPRKINSNTVLVEIRGIRRSNTPNSTQSEFSTFLTDRKDIVSFASIGREFRNEPVSNVVIGGKRNSMYVAWPSEYYANFRTSQELSWPRECSVRNFGGTYKDINPSTGNEATKTATLKVGGFFPFWGLDSATQNPYLDPVIVLDHLAFDDSTLQAKLPNIKIEIVRKTVRTVVSGGNPQHTDVFIAGDRDSDSRPFAVITDIQRIGGTKPTGYVKGLPINEECLIAALSSRLLFEIFYDLYYPDIALNLALRHLDQSKVAAQIGRLGPSIGVLKDDGLSLTSFLSDQENYPIARTRGIVYFRESIYNAVKAYAEEYLGKKYLVCLPKSFIMNRIFDGLAVPTSTERPTIEYKLDNLGYWENLPTEFDGIQNPGAGANADQEDQIRRKFMADNGQFFAMAAMNFYPTGNSSFLSRGVNRIDPRSISSDAFRPNRLGAETPSRIYISCQIKQLIKRPDLAVVDIPSVLFDNRDEVAAIDPNIYQYINPNKTPATNQAQDAMINQQVEIIKWVYKYFNRSPDILKKFTPIGSIGIQKKANIIAKAADSFRTFLSKKTDYNMGPDVNLDLDAIIIPLTSNWVSYGPYYLTNSFNQAMVGVDVDESLVPWNFPRSIPWYANVDAAGQEKVTRSLSPIDYLDNATITVAGFPEFGPVANFGFNSTLTGINVRFDIGSITTTYDFATFNKKPGTFRKGDFDRIIESEIKLRPELPVTINDFAINPYTGGR